MPDEIRRSALLEELLERGGSDAEVEDVVVPEGETRVLSAKAADMKRHFRQIRVRSIDQVKELIGVPDRVASRARGVDSRVFERARTVERRPTSMPARTINPELLASGREGPERLEALSVARMAAERYVYADSGEVLAHKGLIDQYLEHRAATIFAAVFGDITVEDGATFHVTASTLVVRANKLRLHGSGRVVCDGPTTFNLHSVRGNIRPNVLGGPGDLVSGPIRPIDI